MICGLFGMEGVDHENILKRNEDYTIYRDKSSQVQRDVEYLKMWGRFMDGSWFIMQCPYASITESASLANRFLIYLGCIGMVIGGLLVWMFSRSITRPIMELAGLSQEMANLNFDTKYTRGGMDEIGVLGNNFNKMSEKLERTVSELKQANNQLQKDIEQKEKIEDMRNEFLGNVSHELKTPIALIQGYAEGLKEGISEDPARARLPENLPTTTISTALKRSWRILESMSGMENEISLSKTVPLHMSISYLFFFDFEAVILNPLFIKYKLC